MHDEIVNITNLDRRWDDKEVSYPLLLVEAKIEFKFGWNIWYSIIKENFTESARMYSMVRCFRHGCRGICSAIVTV
jgi:hypothetical protein